MRSISIGRCIVITLLAPIVGAASTSIEVDLDGVLGNGPDNISAAISDYIVAELWLVGIEDAVSGAGVTVCNLDGALEFQGATYEVPLSWTLWPPDFSLPGCVKLVAVDYGAAPINVFPALFSTITYHAAQDNAIAEISIDLQNSDFATIGFEVFDFDGYSGGTINIGTTPTGDSHWGEIKNLFR